MSAFGYEKDNNGIVTITMDMEGPVNTMNRAFDIAIGSVVEQLEAEQDLTGVVIASGKKDFFAGGDLKEMLGVDSSQAEAFFNKATLVKSFLRRLEQLPFPVVSAINGAALGGGYEICLTANYRIAVNDETLKVGLPEVSLGLLPGAGGTVRLVHHLGFQKALPFLLEGKCLNAEDALAEGLVDELVSSQDELLVRAKAWILDNKGNEEAAIKPWDVRGYKMKGGNASHPAVNQAIMFAPYMLIKKTKGELPAPELILETAVEAARVDFDTALKIESRQFIALLLTPVAQNLIGNFLNRKS